MKITRALLKRKRACASQVALFAELFPDGAVVTETACVAVADKFDWDWAALHLLPPLIRAEYDAKLVPIDAEYDAKLAPIEAEYRAKRAPVDAEYRAKLASIGAEHRAKRASLFGRMAK